MAENKLRKVRKVLLHIEASEVERICREGLGGITVEAIITHSNVKMIVKTGEDEPVKFYNVK